MILSNALRLPGFMYLSTLSIVLRAQLHKRAFLEQKVADLEKGLTALESFPGAAVTSAREQVLDSF